MYMIFCKLPGALHYAHIISCSESEAEALDDATWQGFGLRGRDWNNHLGPGYCEGAGEAFAVKMPSHGTWTPAQIMHGCHLEGSDHPVHDETKAVPAK